MRLTALQLANALSHTWHPGHSRCRSCDVHRSLARFSTCPIPRPEVREQHFLAALVRGSMPLEAS